MKPRDSIARLYLQAPMVPVERITDGPGGAKLVAITAGFVHWAGGLSLFWWVWPFLLATTFTDYWIGSVRADLEKRYDDDVRRAKLLGKVLGLVLMLFIYWGELLIARSGLVDTQGALAVALSALLIIDELRGLNRHRKQLSGKGVPLLGRILDWIESLVGERIRAAIPPDREAVVGDAAAGHDPEGTDA